MLRTGGHVMAFVSSSGLRPRLTPAARRVCCVTALRPRLPLGTTRPSPTRGGAVRLTMTTTTSTQVKGETKAATPPVKYLKDYRAPAFTVGTVDLRFELGDPDTYVHSKLEMKKQAGDEGASVVLNGDKTLTLLDDGVKMNGRTLSSSEYRLQDHDLIIDKPELDNGRVTIETSALLKAAENKALEGLYKSGGNFCTQCEPEGFRRITYFPDRPDVMATFSTTIVADKSRYPVLLSNGNLEDEGALDGGKHYAKFVDPWPKPSYLFALVAGQLVHIEDFFTTMSSRKVSLKIFVREGDLPKCTHAMESLKRAMKWDEEMYGREYDLDVFNIVAVDDFNMGAMENKSLNVFNSRYVLVSPETATDSDFNAVEGVIAHEYFHNWTGNRVTCRDWFQLSLKEGLTVFRDQSFSADMRSKAVKRVGDVLRLKLGQFPEDSGPMAHPVRPESYIEMNNFYTATVYQKGAEVIRMLHTLLGADGYRQGTDLYFERHDGQAVTCDDWVAALQDANPHVDLAQFRRWYNTAGTPKLTIDQKYDEDTRTLRLHVQQSIPNVGGQSDKPPLHIPLSVGLVTDGDEEANVVVEGDDHPALTKVLHVREKEQTFVLKDVPKGAVVSLLRDFSAPVNINLKGGDSMEKYAFLMKHESNEYNRYEASQMLSQTLIDQYLEQMKAGAKVEDLETLPDVMVDAFRAVILDESGDASLRALALTLPSESLIAERLQTDVDPIAIHHLCDFIRRTLATRLRTELEAMVQKLGTAGEYSIDPVSQGRRGLRSRLLSFLSTIGDAKFFDEQLEVVRNGDNMTEVLAALNILATSRSPQGETALAEFYEKWKDDYLVVGKWLSIQAGAPREDALQVVKGLMSHEAFDISNPNKVYAVIGGLCMGNAFGFHASGEESYRFLADQVIRLNEINPQVASRMARAFARYRMYEAPRRDAMQAELKRVASCESLSGDVYEIVNKILEK